MAAMKGKGNPNTTKKNSSVNNAPKAGGSTVQGKGNKFKGTGKGC